MSIWCIYVDDKGMRGSKMRKHSQDNFGRHFALYNDEKKEMKMLSEREAVNFIRKGNIVQNLKLDEFNTWIEGSTGSLDKITNKNGYVVIERQKDADTGELLGIRVVDSSGEDNLLSFQEVSNLFSRVPAQNAKLSHSTLMGINWSIPDKEIKVQETLLCRLFFRNWGDFNFSLIDEGESLALSLVANKIYVQIECPSNLIVELENVLNKKGLYFRKASDGSYIISFDLLNYKIEDIIYEMSNIAMEVHCRSVFTFNFMLESVNWCTENIDLSIFYKSLDPSGSIEKYPTDMDIETCTSRIFRAIGSILDIEIQKICKSLGFKYVAPLTFFTLSDVKYEFPNLGAYQVGCALNPQINLRLIVKKIEEKKGFFSRFFK